ncbi:MAG: type II toxin-antitoxin system VapC family toxin [Planctomycetes bacterium]|nr:type II toxin-antitoxin system VapC family toxin [Planctomycetota bacterium]
MRIASSPVYLDTSALAKLYVPEPESVRLESALLGRRDLVVADLAVTELASAILRRVRQSELPLEGAQRIYRRLLRDLDSGEYQRAELTPAVHRRAERLLLTLGTRVGLRAADALHLALAMASGARSLLTFDRALRAAALALGILELPGENEVGRG